MNEWLHKKKLRLTQEGSLIRKTDQKPPGILHLQGNAGNRAVADLIGSFSGVPQPSTMRTPIGVSTTVYFAKDSILLDPANFQAVEDLANEMGYLFEPVVSIDGHASGEGSATRNQGLSERRRQVVMSLLTYGLEKPPVIKGEAFGETQPAVPEEAAEGPELEKQRAQNRRVEITIAYNPRSVVEPPKKKINLWPGGTVLEPPSGPMDFNPPPAIKKPKISISGEFDKKFDRVVDDILDGLSIRKSWARTILKKGARAAIDKGAETLLDQAMDEAGLKGDTREAFKKSLEAGLKFEF